MKVSKVRVKSGYLKGKFNARVKQNYIHGLTNGSYMPTSFACETTGVNMCGVNDGTGFDVDRRRKSDKKSTTGIGPTKYGDISAASLG